MSSDSIPTLSDNGHIILDEKFLSSLFGRTVSSIKMTSMSEAGGLSCETFRLSLQFEPTKNKKMNDKEEEEEEEVEENLSLVLKRTKTGGEEFSKAIGLNREGKFYQQFLPPSSQNKKNKNILNNSSIGLNVDNNKNNKENNKNKTLASFLPKVYWSYANDETGIKYILMEDLSKDSIQSGYFFGSYSPLNWGKTLQQITTQFLQQHHIIINNDDDHHLSVKNVTNMAFEAAAILHATYWQNPLLLLQEDDDEDHHHHNHPSSWLRGSQWICGKDQESWWKSQQQCIDSWNKTKQQQQQQKIDNNNNNAASGGVKWDNDLIACMDASINKIDWNVYQKELKQRPFTLVHGDFHPANCMIRAIHPTTTSKTSLSSDGKNDDEPMNEDNISKNKLKLVLLDFEVVGVGSGPQDLGQYMISHTTPQLRKELEKDAVHLYYDTLLHHYYNNHNKEEEFNMSFEECWNEYIMGGFSRWVWLLSILSQNISSVHVLQYFHDQLLAFIQTHDIITPDNVSMPRA